MSHVYLVNIILNIIFLACQAAFASATCHDFVVAGLPYDSNGNEVYGAQVLRLSPASNSFTVMSHQDIGGTWMNGVAAFTMDGEFGVIPLKNGNVTVIKLDCAGVAQIVVQNLIFPDYVDSPVVDTVDTNRFWLFSDRAVYSMYIHRSNQTVVIEGLYVDAYIPATFQFVSNHTDGQLAIMVVNNGLINIIDWAAKKIIASQSAWPAGIEPIVTGSCILGSGDDRYMLLLDDNQFSGTGNTISVVRLQGLTSSERSPEITQVQVIPNITDPASIICSPYGNSVVVASGEGNSILHISFTATNTTAPFANGGPITYKGAAPQLPSSAVLTRAHSSSPGLVFFAELSGVRQCIFHETGQVTDLGLFSFGDGMQDICGGIASTI